MTEYVWFMVALSAYCPYTSLHEEYFFIRKMQRTSVCSRDQTVRHCEDVNVGSLWEDVQNWHHKNCSNTLKITSVALVKQKIGSSSDGCFTRRTSNVRVIESIPFAIFGVPNGCCVMTTVGSRSSVFAYSKQLWKI